MAEGDRPDGIEKTASVLPQHEARRAAATSIDRLVARVPSVERDKLLGVESLALDQQASVFHAVSAAVPESEGFLLELSTAKKMTDPRYDDRDDPYFVDPLVHQVERGHRVVIVHEEPQGGVSRHQARFLGKVSESGAAIVVNTDDPDIITLGIDPESHGTGLRFQQPVRQIGDPPVTPDQLAGAVQDTGATGVQGLFELYMGHPGHPAFKTGKAAAEAIQGMTTNEYQLKLAVGTVTQTARPDNDGMIILDDGTEIEQVNTRFVAVVGMDEESFLTRGEDEIYLHRPVRVWYKDKWQTGRIAGFGPRGMVEVRCDDKVSEREDYMDGHGVTVGGKSFDLDLSDPSQPEKRHPLEDYPMIRNNNCIRFMTSDGRVAYGWIDGINAAGKMFQVETQLGFEQLSFDTPFEVIDTPSHEPEDPLLKKGNTFKIHDPQADKDRVFEIKGVDEENDLVIGEIVSLRPSGMSIAHVFPKAQVDLLGSPEQVLEQYPYLGGRYKNYQPVKVRFRHEDEVLEGELRTSETLPAFVEVIIPKDPPPRGNSVDVYNRYDVKVEDLIGPVD